MTNLQDTPTLGALTAADLDAARKHSTGRILHAGLDYQGRHPTRPLPEDCAEEGGEHREPSKTMRESPAIGLLLVLLGWPAVAAAVAVIAAVVHYVPRIG